MSDIHVPTDLWDAGNAGVISTWYFNDGDRVAGQSVIAEVMYEKSSFEILSPADGILRIAVPVETEIELGQAIGRVEAA